MKQKQTDRNTDHGKPRTPADDRRELVESDRDGLVSEGNTRATGGYHTEEMPRSKHGGRVHKTSPAGLAKRGGRPRH